MCEHEYHNVIPSGTYNYWKSVAEIRLVELEKQATLAGKLRSQLRAAEDDVHVLASKLDAAEKLVDALKNEKRFLSRGVNDNSVMRVKGLELEVARLQAAIQDMSGVGGGPLRASSLPPITRSLQETVNVHAARADKAEVALKKSADVHRASIVRITELEAALQAEKELRQRVWERFKRVRRDAAAGSINLQQARAEIEKLEMQLAAAHKASKVMDGNAARFATLAYAILEAEDKEVKGKEPSWP